MYNQNNSPFNQFNNANPYSYLGAYQPPQTQNQLPHYELLTGNGRSGAEAIQMDPNSKALILDNLAPRVWLVTTDGCGAKTIKPFRLIEEDEQTGFTKGDKNDIADLRERIERLEAKMNGYKSNTKRNKRRATNKPITSATDTESDNDVN